jgi:ubiquitin-protein ligase
MDNKILFREIVKINQDRNNYYEGQATIEFPQGEENPRIIDIGLCPKYGPFQGGKVTFQLDLSNFPAGSPRCTCLTKIFHPNVSHSGSVCFNMFGGDAWTKDYTLSHYVDGLLWLLAHPNPDSALNGNAAIKDSIEYTKNVQSALNGLNVKGEQYPISRNPDFKLDKKISISFQEFVNSLIYQRAKLHEALKYDSIFEVQLPIWLHSIANALPNATIIASNPATKTAQFSVFTDASNRNHLLVHSNVFDQTEAGKQLSSHFNTEFKFESSISLVEVLDASQRNSIESVVISPLIESMKTVVVENQMFQLNDFADLINLFDSKKIRRIPIGIDSMVSHMMANSMEFAAFKKQFDCSAISHSFISMALKGDMNFKIAHHSTAKISWFTSEEGFTYNGKKFTNAVAISSSKDDPSHVIQKKFGQLVQVPCNGFFSIDWNDPSTLVLMPNEILNLSEFSVPLTAATSIHFKNCFSLFGQSAATIAPFEWSIAGTLEMLSQKPELLPQFADVDPLIEMLLSKQCMFRILRQGQIACNATNIVALQWYNVDAKPSLAIFPVGGADLTSIATFYGVDESSVVAFVPAPPGVDDPTTRMIMAPLRYALNERLVLSSSVALKAKVIMPFTQAYSIEIEVASLMRLFPQAQLLQ